MIVKRIPAMPSVRNRGSLRARHAQQLIDYLRLPEKADPYREYLVAYLASQKLGDMSAERLLHVGARNFLATTLDGRRLEMMATAQAAVRSPNPIDHWLLSWRLGEFPTSEQVDQTVAMFLADLGLARAQCVYALHGDTHNRHVHIAVNRYDPSTQRVVEINKGFNLEAAHRSVARIVDYFGWAAEENARYAMVDGVAVLSSDASARRAAGGVAIEPGARAYEVRTGYRSAQRVAQEIVLPIIDAAASWAELHASLAEAGFAFEKKKRGAVVILGAEHVKASSLSRRTSLGGLENRLGSFEARAPAVLIMPRDDQQDIMTDAHRAYEYRIIRQRHTRAAISHKLSGGRRAKPEPVPKDLESFLLGRGDEYYAARWSRRGVPEPDWLVGPVQAAWQPPQTVGRYVATVMPDCVVYALPDGPTAFIERGRRIEVPPGSDEALLAALQLAAAKYGRFKVDGSNAFRARVAALATEHGLGGHLAGIDAPPSTSEPRQTPERRAAQVHPKLPGEPGPMRQPLDEPMYQRVQAHVKGPTTEPANRIELPSLPITSAQRAKPDGSVPAERSFDPTDKEHRPYPISIAKGPEDISHAPALPSGRDWSITDYRADPARIAAIEGLIAELAAENHLPLKPTRVVMPSGESVTRFEICAVQERDQRHGLFRRARAFEDEDQVQRLYADAYRHALTAAEAVLVAEPRLRVAVGEGRFSQLEAADYRLSDALAVLQGTDNLATLLRRVDRRIADADERARLAAEEQRRTMARLREKAVAPRDSETTRGPVEPGHDLDRWRGRGSPGR